MKKKIMVTLLSLLSAVCVSVSVIAVASAASSSEKASTATWEEVTIPADLAIGDTLDLPARSCSVDGKSYNSTVTLTYPDGTAVLRTTNKPTANLTLAGKYTLSFSIKEGSVRLSEEESFIVADKLWKAENAKSSFSYGAGTLAEESAKGLLVSLARGDTLTFGKIIDLSEIDETTVLVSGYVNPKDHGTAEFDSLTFTFTDVYDPETTLTITGIRSLGSDDFAKGMSYWMANGNGQAPSGFEDSKYHHNDGYGAKFQHSWSAMAAYWRTATDNGSDPSYSNRNPFQLRFDPKEVKTYVGSTYITDLDDATLHDGEPVWKGFKSNKVILTITAGNVSGESANFCITSLLGYDFTSENAFTETDAPVITVNNDDGLIEGNKYVYPALKGGSYPVASATAFDEYAGELTVQTQVYYNYKSETELGTLKAIKDGRFNVDKAGNYAVIYTATDYFGNSTKKIYYVTAKTALDTPLSVTVGDEKPSTGTCGERVVLPEATVNGGSGKTTVVITATCGSQTVTAENGMFLPESAGTWTITYTASDITATTATDSFQMTVTASDKPVFVDEVTLPKYLIAKASYVVPEVKAIDYSTGTKKSITATLTVDGKTYNAGERFTVPSATDGTNTKLTFTAGKTTKEYEILTVNPYNLLGRFQIQDMFRSEGLDKSRSDNGLALTASSAGTVGWEFANPVAATDSSVLINGVSGKDDFSALQVTFTDYADPSVAVTVNIVNQKGSNASLLFGDADRTIPQGFSLTDNAFEIGYNGTKFYVGNVRVNVTKTDGGAAFNGFPSGKVYISAKTLDTVKGASYIVKKIDNHSISNLNGDKTKPRVIIEGEYGGLYDVGDRYVISKALASDVIDPSATLTLTVKDPSGKVVSDVNGKQLSAVAADVDYEIVLTAVGQYKVEYKALDASENEGTLSYGINIIDKVAPTITFGSADKTATVGTAFLLPSVTVSDDVTASANIKVYLTVRTSNGVLNELGDKLVEESNGNTYTVRYRYTFRYKGKYTFMVLAMDEAGNQTLAEYVVTVK